MIFDGCSLIVLYFNFPSFIVLKVLWVIIKKLKFSPHAAETVMP